MSWLNPAAEFSAEVRDHIEQERRGDNLRRASRSLPVLALTHLLVLFSAGNFSPDQQREMSWAFVAMLIHMFFITFYSAMWLVLRKGQPTRLRDWIHAHSGELIISVVLPVFALVAINAQRTHGSVIAFVMSCISAPLWFRLRTPFFLIASGVAVVVLCVGIEWTQADLTTRFANRAICAGFWVSAAWLSYFTCHAHARDVGQRTLLDGLNNQLQSLNQNLQQRVDEQVHEIVTRATEIESLNRQLNERIRERSRELSRALARLALERQGAIPAGTVLADRVVISGLIGMGGMGAVYRGHDQVLGHTVAVKVVQATSAAQLDALSGFLAEAETLASVRHPAIIRSYHVDVASDGRLFQVLELIDGTPLAEVFAQDKRFSSGEVARIGSTIAGALAAAHEAGIVHRDVTPGNVMLTLSTPGAKLLDFGLSTLRERPTDNESRSDVVIGTPAFMSPEQIEAPRNVSTASDVYSLGLVLYQCLAGTSPYIASSVPDWLVAHTMHDPIAIERRCVDVDSRLATEIMRCLSKDPAARPSSKALCETLFAIAQALQTPEVIDWVLAPPAEPTTTTQEIVVTGTANQLVSHV